MSILSISDGRAERRGCPSASSRPATTCTGARSGRRCSPAQASHPACTARRFARGLGAGLSAPQTAAHRAAGLGAPRRWVRRDDRRGADPRLRHSPPTRARLRPPSRDDPPVHPASRATPSPSTRLGGAPRWIRYDNLSSAITRVLRDRDRVESERFVALRSRPRGRVPSSRCCCCTRVPFIAALDAAEPIGSVDPALVAIKELRRADGGRERAVVSGWR